MNTALLLLIHATGLVVALLTIWGSGESPRVLLYAFVLDYLLRLWTIHAMLRAVSSSRPSMLRAIVPRLTRLPFARQISYPVTVGETGSDQPAGLSGYLVVIAVFTYFAFMLIHADADQELSFNARVFMSELSWGTVIALVYWSEALATRSIVLDPEATRTINFGYNTRDVTVFALAVLTGGGVVVIRQQMELGASGWAVLGPLLFYRALYDFTYTLQLRKADNKSKASAS